MTSWPRLRSFSTPDQISFFRGLLGVLLTFLVLSDSRALHLASFPIFIFAALTDYWDGWLARKQGTVSGFGKILDPSMDKIMVLGPYLAFAMRGQVSPVWLIPIFVRELIVTFCRVGWFLEGQAAGAEKIGKIKFAVQVFALLAPFLGLLAQDYGWASAGKIFDAVSKPILLLAVVLTVVSGIDFFRVNFTHFKSPFFAKFVSAAGVGLVSFAPGTWGSLFAIPFILLTAWNPLLFWAAFLGILLAGAWAVGRLDLRRDKDPSFVVIDEVLGMFLAMAMIPLSWQSLLAGFLLFRFFDILKPYPLRNLEKLPGYWGILCDDLGAGFYTWLIMVMIFR